MWGKRYFCGTVGEVKQRMIDRKNIEKLGREDGNDNFSIGEE